MSEIINVKGEEMAEYWAMEYKCPFCEGLGMHRFENFCSDCGKSFENVEFFE